MIEQVIKETVSHAIQLEFSLIEDRIEKIQKTPDIMTLSQLCDYLGLTAPTIRKAIKDNGLPVKKVFGDKAPRFVKKQVDAWLESQI